MNRRAALAWKEHREAFERGQVRDALKEGERLRAAQAAELFTAAEIRAARELERWRVACAEARQRERRRA